MYTFTLREEQGDHWQFTAMGNGTVQFTAPVSCSAFIERLTQAATAVLAHCRKNGWSNKDVDALARLLKANS